VSTFSDEALENMTDQEFVDACQRAERLNRPAEAKLAQRALRHHHGAQVIVQGYAITYLDPILSLGHATKVTEMYRARKLGAPPQDDCLLFYEQGALACYRHTFCPAQPAVESVRASGEVK
jgi:hypothetical protein